MAILDDRLDKGANEPEKSSSSFWSVLEKMLLAFFPKSPQLLLHLLLQILYHFHYSIAQNRWLPFLQSPDFCFRWS